MEQVNRPKSPMENPRAAQRLAKLWHPSMEFMKSVDGMINQIKLTRNQKTPAGLKKLAFMLGLLPEIRPRAEYVVIVSCSAPFTSPHLLHSAFRVLDKYGVEYTILDDEVCCGWIPLESAVASRDWEALRRAEEASRGFIKENVDAALQKGARNLLHFCNWCAYTYNGVQMQGGLGEDAQKVRQQSLLAPIFDRLGRVKLGLKKPTVIGYYEGCHRRSNSVFPEIKIDWSPYRDILDKIQNAEVVDLPNTCCMVAAEKVVENAKKRKVDVLVCSCYACWVYNTLASKGTIQVKFISEILDEASAL